MDRWIDPRIALADQYPGYDISELDHLIEDKCLETKYIPERTRVLFETPSGFAIFGIDSSYLYDIGSDYTGIETIWVHCVDKESADLFIWLRGFLKLDNRSTAILPTGIDESLQDLLEEHCYGVDKLIVGESAYGEAIQKQMGITCVCDEAANELMWGLQNLLRVLVPEEKSEFSKQDRKYHSKKLLKYLQENELNIKPEMINGQVALLASFMHRCDVPCKEYAKSLHSLDDLLMQRSNLKTDNWDIVTHATALMTLMGESVRMPDTMFTKDEKEKIHEEAGKYKDNIIKENMQTIYKNAIQYNVMKFTKKDELMIILRNAEAAARGSQDSGEMLTELPQVFCPKRSFPEAEDHGQWKKLKVDDDDVDMIQSGATMD